MWTGDYATATATVTVVDRSKEAQPVTIRYVDPDGKEIHKKKELHGTIGEAFDVSDKKYQPAIPNYTLDNKQLPKNAKGLFSDKAQTVTYVYQPVMTPTTTTSDSSSETTPPSTTTDTSTTTETSSSSQSSGKISDTSSSTSGGNVTPAGTSSTPPSNRGTAKQTDKKLPQTNEKITPAYLLAGLAILSFATGLLIVSRKKVN
jgi:LPXTG-motif cell wall-anchored protein